MTSKFAAALSAALVLSIGAARAADVPPDVTKTIIADYALGCAAALDPSDANLTAAFGFYSPDFVNTDVKGKKFTRDQVVANGKQQMKQLHTTACEPSIVSQTLNADGTVTSWMVEGGSPNTLLRNGFTKAALPPGTEIVGDGYQSKDESNKMNGRDITFPDGRKLFVGSAGQGSPDKSEK